MLFVNGLSGPEPSKASTDGDQYQGGTLSRGLASKGLNRTPIAASVLLKQGQRSRAYG